MTSPTSRRAEALWRKAKAHRQADPSTARGCGDSAIIPEGPLALAGRLSPGPSTLRVRTGNRNWVGSSYRTRASPNGIRGMASNWPRRPISEHSNRPVCTQRGGRRPQAPTCSEHGLSCVLHKRCLIVIRFSDPEPWGRGTFLGVSCDPTRSCELVGFRLSGCGLLARAIRRARC